MKRNIIIIGRTGNGKSALANVLVNKDEDFIEFFGEGKYGVSKTKDIQVKEFEHEGINFRIIDTIGIGDTKLTSQEVLCEIGKSSHAIKDGLTQIIFAVGGRFTKEDIDAYQSVKRIIFDDDAYKYTTIVRTKFSEFENEQACEKDKQVLIDNSQDYADLIN